MIRARISSVSLTCAVTSLCTFALLVFKGGYGNADAVHALGYWPLGLGAAFRAWGLTALLFLGPLFEALVVESGWRAWTTLEPVKEVWEEWTAWRNFIAVSDKLIESPPPPPNLLPTDADTVRIQGPLTEEILFRSAAVPLMILARTPLTRTIFVSPLVFGLAHAHHLYEFRVTHPGVPLPAAVARSLFQLGYTTLFGAYATFLYLRTGSLLAVFAVHVLCNCMGLPRVWGRVHGRTADEGEPVVVARWWSLAYYVLLVAGAVGWYRELWTLTESGNALVVM